MTNYITYEVRVYTNGAKYWFLNGNTHREDGPAVERLDGTKEWWLNDKRHREDGPAVEWASGFKEWWLNGEQLTEEEFISRTSNASCIGKVIAIDGRKYKLTPV